MTIIPLKMQFLFMKNYTYLIFHKSLREAIVIDPTWEMEKIEATLAQYQLMLRAILVTHTHPDHIHLVRPLVKKYNCQVLISEKDATSFTFLCGNLTPSPKP